MAVPKSIVKTIEKQFKTKTVFIPGRTRIALIQPTFGPQEIVEALDSLLTTKVTMGDKVHKFENLFSKYLKVRYASMVNSGSSANLIALSALTNPWFRRPIKRNTQVITPAVTWATTVYPLVNLGLKPKFVDINLETFCMETDNLEKTVSSNTSLILPVHLLGNVCDMQKITEVAQKKDVFVMEDCCEAHGAEFKGKKVGTFGNVGTFSFFLSHHITTIEGGMIVTNDESIHELSKAIRAFGWIRDLKNKNKLAKKFHKIDHRFLFVNLGYNLRPTEIQGAFGMHQISKLEKFIKIRKENFRYWTSRLSQYEDFFIIPKEDSKTRPVHFCYPLTIKKDSPFGRESLIKYLEGMKIETRPIMAGNFVEQPVIQLIPHIKNGSLPNSRLAMRNSFFFGNHQGIGKKEREYVADAIAQFVERKLWKR